MSTATLASEARRNVALFSQPQLGGKKFQMYVKPAAGDKPESLVIKGMPVFRSGTFRDSMGYQHTWEDLHMSQMVANFNHLQSTGLLPHVPVRKGHAGFLDSGGTVLDNVLGYHTALDTEKQTNEVDGKEYTYLLADYEIVDPDAMSKIQRGQWRNMSSEVGSWLTNDEAEYWPVYQGVAYVDFSAVEGLKTYSSASGVGTSFSVMSEQEPQMADTVTPPTPPMPPVPPAAQPGTQTPPVNPAAPVVPEVTQHAAPTQLTFQFALANGTQTSDFAAVQAELTRLGTFEKESRESGRKMFVKGLVDAGKLLEPNKADTEAFCLSLTDDQFLNYTKQWDAVPTNPVFAGQGVQGTSNHGATQPVGSAPAQPDEVETALETVKQFQMSGMKVEQIKMTPTYAKLVTAGKAPF